MKHYSYCLFPPVLVAVGCVLLGTSVYLFLFDINYGMLSDAPEALVGALGFAFFGLMLMTFRATFSMDPQARVIHKHYRVFGLLVSRDQVRIPAQTRRVLIKQGVKKATAFVQSVVRFGYTIKSCDLFFETDRGLVNIMNTDEKRAQKIAGLIRDNLGLDFVWQAEKRPGQKTHLTLMLGALLLVTPFCRAQDYAIGADLSFLKMAEDQGFSFKEDGQPKPGLRIFKDHGYNWIRLRLFHTPTQLPNDLDYTLALAREAKAMGYKFLLDYHYSDTWADPGKQFIPGAWEGLSHETLVDSVYAYTRNTMKAFGEAGAFPDMVQVGNEISHGMLWPDGKLPEHWEQFAELVRAGINGIHAGCGNRPCPEIMIHIDKGGDRQFTRYFFDKLHSYGIEYDVIGQSYYPWWHGNLLQLRECLNFTARAYQKNIILVEVAYNWMPVEYKDAPAPFPESPEGQRAFLEEVNRIVLQIPDDRGSGVFWWEPAVSRRGSRSFFDEQGHVLPVIEVFDKYTRK